MKKKQFPVYPVIRSSISWDLPNGTIARFGHGYVNDMALSPNGRYLSVAGDTGIWLYDISTESIIAIWDKGEAPYSALTFSDDAKLISIADSCGVVRVFDLINGTCLAEFDHGLDRGILQLRFSPDSHVLAVSSRIRDENDSVHVWKVPKSDQETISSFQYKTDNIYEGTAPVAFSIDNCLLACANNAPKRCISPPEEGSISVWDAKTHERIAHLSGLPDFVASLCFSPCGRLLAAGDWTGTVYVWEVSNGRLCETYPSRGAYYMIVSYSPSATLYTIGVSRDSNTLLIWDMEQEKMCFTSKRHSRYFPVHFSEGKRIVFGSHDDFQVYTIETGEHQKVSHLHSIQTSNTLVASRDQKKLLSTGNKGVFVWTIANPEQQPEVFIPCMENNNGEYSSTFCLSAGILTNEKYFTIAALQNTIGLWEVGNDTPIIMFTTHTEPRKAAFSPITSILACRDEDAQIYLWDIQSRKLRYSYRSEYPEAHRMEFSPNGRYFVSGADIFYDIVHNEKIEAFELNEMSIHLFSPDSSQFFCDTYETIEAWDILQVEKALSIPKPETWFCSDVVALVLSPCGKYLAGCCDEVPEELYLWAIDGGNPLTVFKGHSPIMSLTFSPDTTLLASGSYDGTILLWDMKPYLRNA